MQEAAHNQPEYTVSEISGAIRRVVEGEFGFVRVRGEISEAKFHSSGHVYITLKDEKSSLKAVVWKGKLSGLKIRPQVGLEVIAIGKVTTYAASSNYQLNIDQMEPSGEGALMALLEKRKKDLADKGLFDESRKRIIPKFPQIIGVVTSPTGAVIKDIIHRISERFPLHVLIWSVKVQGEGAEHEIAAAIRGFNLLPQKPDILIVARGGGSLEDLWCFNAEEVVYAVAESKIPIISAVGHETDTTLIDFAADLRAPTPTAAAEIATQITISDLRFIISDFGNRISLGTSRLLEKLTREVEGLKRGIPKLSEIINSYQQRLDDWTERLASSLPNLVSKMSQKLQIMISKLNISGLKKDISRAAEKLTEHNSRLQNAYIKLLGQREEKLVLAGKLLESYHYRKVLERGFTLTKALDGKIIRSAGAVEDNMVIEFADGEVKISKRA